MSEQITSRSLIGATSMINLDSAVSRAQSGAPYAKNELWAEAQEVLQIF